MTTTPPNTSSELRAKTAATSTTQAPKVATAAAAPKEEGGGMPNPVALVRRAINHWPVVFVTLVLGALITAQIARTRTATFKSESVMVFRGGMKLSDAPGTDMKALAARLKESTLAQSTLKRTISDCRAYRDIVQKRGLTDAVDTMRKKVDFKGRGPETFVISFEGNAPDEAQRCTARLVDIIIAEEAKAQATLVKGSTEFLENEKKRFGDEVEKLEKEFYQFMEDHPEVAGAAGKQGVLIASKFKKEEDAAKRASKAKSKKGKSGAGPRRRGASPVPVKDDDDGAAAVDPVLLAQLKAAQNEVGSARKDHADKSAKFTEAHPDVRLAAARLAAAQEALAAAQAAVDAAKPAPAPKKIAMPDDPYEEPSAKPKAAAAPSGSPSPDDEDKDKEKTQVKKPPSDSADAELIALETEWTRINRELNEAKGHFGDVSAKLYKAEAIARTYADGYGPELIVLDPAFKPGKPNNMPNKTVVAIGLVASILVGLVISAAWGLFLDDRLFHASEVENMDLVPLLGTVPRREDKQGKGRAKRPQIKPA